MDAEEMEADDPMEIDDSVPASTIIERKSDEYSESDLNTAENPPKSPRTNEPPPLAENPSEVTDIVVLDDEDDNPTEGPVIAEVIDLVEKSHSGRCLNPFCDSKSNDYIRPPDFCFSYYKVKKSKKQKEEICCECYDQSVHNYDELVDHLIKGEGLFEVDYPIVNETLQIDDSDEDENIDAELDHLDDENVEFLSENIDNVLIDMLEKYNFSNQLDMNKNDVMVQNEKIDGDLKALQEKAKETKNTLDSIQKHLYNQFMPEYKQLKGLLITDDVSLSSNLVIKTENPFEVPRKSTRSHRPVSYVELEDGNSGSPKTGGLNGPEHQAPKDLPPALPIEKPLPQLNEIYYIIRENFQGSWIRARVVEIINSDVAYARTMYTMIELKQQRERLLSGKHIACMECCQVRLSVGMRVISVLQKDDDSETNGTKSRHNHYYAGIVAEQPFEGNRYRYLIFFDIGYSQYVSYHSVNLVLESSPNVWDDVMEDSRPFIKKYLESQDRPMVKLTKDQTVKVEYNGKWWMCTVVDVDCSLVQVSFDELKRTEWIYRGSTRLSPMYREEQAATNRNTIVRSRKIGQNESAAVVQYTRNNDYVQPAISELPSTVRAVARKSTTRPQGGGQAPTIVPFLPSINSNPPPSAYVTGPTSKIMYFTPRDQVVMKKTCRRHHSCSPDCKEYLTHSYSQLRGHNPLSKPLLCGWGRVISRAKGRKEILYKTPCGKLLKNITEVHLYLRMTESEMTVDLFDFSPLVRCLAEFSVECTPDPKDLSRGVEQVPIPVINGIGNDMLDFCNYSVKRVPMEGVNLNLDPEFLCGCDCVDDCSDKTKCACWKRTLESIKFTGKDADPNHYGYVYKRLPESVMSGIYECNSRCKCASTCLNRVVQHPMSLKLQVFKTVNRGWGIRCLNDIPQGTFICIYAGTIHTEVMANKDGIANGDEYFAELDYIETVEKFKEDYEEEAGATSDDGEGERSPKSPLDEDEERAKQKNKGYHADNDFTPVNRGDRLKVKESNITTRLRRKTTTEEDIKAPKEPKLTVKIKQEIVERNMDIKTILENLPADIETVTISDEEDEGREVLSFNPKGNLDEKESKYPSIRELFGEDESVYVMDAKTTGNIGRFLNHSCSPNVFVQNVFVDTHDLRFPWVSFFSSQYIRAGTELTWNYSYDIGSVPGRVLYCYCASTECKGRLL